MNFMPPTVGSYFNPFSNKYFHTDRFNTLPFSKKLAIVALTTFATILTLPIAGLGGLATYRALTRKFSIVNNTTLLEGFSEVNEDVLPTSNKNEDFKAAVTKANQKGNSLL